MYNRLFCYSLLSCFCILFVPHVFAKDTVLGAVGTGIVGVFGMFAKLLSLMIENTGFSLMVLFFILCLFMFSNALSNTKQYKDNLGAIFLLSLILASMSTIAVVQGIRWLGVQRELQEGFFRLVFLAFVAFSVFVLYSIYSNNRKTLLSDDADTMKLHERYFYQVSNAFLLLYMAFAAGIALLAIISPATLEEVIKGYFSLFMLIFLLYIIVLIIALLYSQASDPRTLTSTQFSKIILNSPFSSKHFDKNRQGLFKILNKLRSLSVNGKKKERYQKDKAKFEELFSEYKNILSLLAKEVQEVNSDESSFDASLNSLLIFLRGVSIHSRDFYIGNRYMRVSKLKYFRPKLKHKKQHKLIKLGTSGKDEIKDQLNQFHKTIVSELDILEEFSKEIVKERLELGLLQVKVSIEGDKKNKKQVDSPYIDVQYRDTITLNANVMYEYESASHQYPSKLEYEWHISNKEKISIQQGNLKGPIIIFDIKNFRGDHSVVVQCRVTDQGGIGEKGVITREAYSRSITLKLQQS